MGLEGRGHGSRLVRRQVVENHMDLTPARLAGHDLPRNATNASARVPRHGLTERFPGLGVQRGEQRQRAVPDVLEAVALDAAGRQR